MSIIDQFTDVDFRRCKEYVKGYDSFGNMKVCGRYGDAVDLIPEDEWDDREEELNREDSGADKLVVEILNQRNEGSCVGNAGTQGNQIVQAAQFGKDRVTKLSAISLYKQIGSGPNSGAMVSDALDKGRSVGWVPLDTPENRERFGSFVMPPTGFYSKFPEGFPAKAKQFCYHECDIVDSMAEMMTALLRRQPVIVGRQGHSICYCKTMKRNGSRVAKYANSWGDWGDAGFGYDSLSQMRMSADWAFAIRSVCVPEHLK